MTHNTHTHAQRCESTALHALRKKNGRSTELRYTMLELYLRETTSCQTYGMKNSSGWLSCSYVKCNWVNIYHEKNSKQTKKKMREEKICVNQVNQKKLAKTVKEEKHQVPSSHHLSMIGNWLLWLVALSPLTTHHPLSENPYDYWRSPRPMLKKSLINFYHKIEYWHEGNSA